MKFTEASIKNPVTVAVAVMLVALFGILALLRIPVQLTPDVDKPEITVKTYWPGASPQEIEREVIDEQEDKLKSVEGLWEMKSESRDSVGEISLKFHIGENIDAARLKVANTLNTVPDYPEGVEEPIIVTSGGRAKAIAWMILKTTDGKDKKNINVHRDFVEDYIKPRIERVPGVAESEIYGGWEREMQVILDLERMASLKVTIPEVSTAILKENENISAGNFDEGKRRFIVRTVGEYGSPRDVMDVVVKYVESSPVYVGDVAQVKLGYENPEYSVYHTNKPTIAFNAKRQTGANVITVMRGIKEAIRELNRGLLKDRGLKILQVYDETEYIDSAIRLVKNNLYVGSILAISVLLIFLRSTRSTLIISLAIPISVVGTFLLMNIFGRNINVISLAGMAFAVGMVLDASIVVLENIFRHIEMGKPPFKAALEGTQEVWGAVLSSTLTTMAVFIPVVFVAEEAGQLFKDIAIAISCAVGVSLFVSIGVIPTMAARILRARDKNRVSEKPRLLSKLDKAADGFRELTARFVYHMIGSALLSIAVVAALTLGALGLAWSLIPKAEYLPEGNRNFVIALVLPPPGYNLDELTNIGLTMANGLKPYWDLPKDVKTGPGGIPAIENMFFVARGQFIFSGITAREPERVQALIPLFNREIGKIPGLIPVVSQRSLFTRAVGGGRTIDVEITGPELQKLVELGQRVFFSVLTNMPKAQARPIPSLDLGNPEVRIIPDRVRAARMGLTAEDLGIIVDVMLDGRDIADYKYEGEDIDLVLKGSKERIGHTQDFDQLPVRTPTGQLVTLDSLAKILWTSGPVQINHIENRRAVTIQVVPPRTMPLEEAMDLIEAKVVGPIKGGDGLGRLYEIKLAGTVDDLTLTREALKGNFVLAIIITYLLMSSLFASFLYPLVIMFSVPLAAAGGFLGLFLVNLLLTYQPLDVLTMLGFVILVGTVVNNAILIVHQSLNHMRYDGMERRSAIEEAVRNRMRPIFMSTTTSILGMLPLVIFPGAGSELYRGLGGVVLGGLALSTIFTLLLIPALFNLMLMARMALWRAKGLDKTDADF